MMSNVEDIRNEFKKKKCLKDVKDFLDIRASRHNYYFHYTTVTALKNMLESKTLYLSLGRTMNDLLEIQKIAPEKWNRLYVASFSYTANESVALWHIYGNPLSDAIRIQFSRAAIKNMLKKAKENLTCKSVNNGEVYEIYKIKSIKLVDIAYLQNSQKSLKWNRTFLTDSFCKDLSQINSYKELAGYIKNIAWEYEVETRFLVELDGEETDTFPEKIKIDAENLWKGAKILCGPCLPAENLKKQMNEFFEKNEDAIHIDVDNITNSSLLNRVHFRPLCMNCKAEIDCNFKSERKVKDNA